MSLIDDLRQVADLLPPSHVPSLNEIAGVVGAVIAHTEHGDSLFTAAAGGAEQVAKLFAPVAATVAEAAVPEAAPVIALAEKAVEQLPAPAAPAPAAETSTPVELEAQSDAAKLAEAMKTIEALQTALANAQHGEVKVG